VLESRVIGQTAIVIAVFYAVVVVLGAAVAIAVWRSTRRRDPDADTELLARREKAWFVITVALLAGLLFATIFFTPYGKSAPSNAQVVQVQGFQFGWLIEPSSIRAGVPVEFQLRSRDANHAFAVYNADDVLLFQVQVVPERTQKYVYTFKKPGTYEVLCFEYCGLDHDLMRATLEVTP